jgi:hypothetical protein
MMNLRTKAGALALAVAGAVACSPGDADPSNGGGNSGSDGVTTAGGGATTTGGSGTSGAGGTTTGVVAAGGGIGTASGGAAGSVQSGGASGSGGSAGVGGASGGVGAGGASGSGGAADACGGTGDPLASRPNDGTGCWPDDSNTGYEHAPGYPGALTDFPLNAGTYIRLDSSYNGKTLRFYRFRATVYMVAPVDRIFFYGCEFESNAVNNIMVNDFNTTESNYSYCTFQPSAVSAPPVSCSQSYQIAINQSRSQAMTVDHCNIWGMGNGIQFGASSQAHPLVFSNNYIHDAADPNNAGGCNYHHDGIGPCSDGGIGYITIDHNTIASTGNTNGIALQGTRPYDHLTITNNYISGWGYAVSLGAGMTATNDTNVTFTGNVYSGKVPTIYGPLYGNVAPGPGKGNVWQRNSYQVRSGDPWGQVAYNGQSWWPTDNVGHATDYTSR